MQLEERFVGDVAVIRVSGDIALNQGGDIRLHDKVRSLLQQGYTNQLLDLASVSYVDSAGLGQLVQAYSTVRNQGGALRLVSLTKRLQDLLVITRLATVFDTYDTEAEALASFGSAAPA